MASSDNRLIVENCKEDTLRIFTGYADSQDYHSDLQTERVIFISEQPGAEAMCAACTTQLTSSACPMLAVGTVTLKRTMSLKRGS